MGEIEDIVTLYIEDSDILENEATKISNSLEENIQDVIAPGQVGYDTGHLHDSVTSDFDIDDKIAIVTGWYSVDYGRFWYRWKDGVDFMSKGLQKTVEMYK